ncbi:hypothetical protein Q427_23070 [Halomonas sp. BC04]|nr:hypothetical protein Q427_23070 [Halomonas sp. BC04]
MPAAGKHDVQRSSLGTTVIRYYSDVVRPTMRAINANGNHRQRRSRRTKLIVEACLWQAGDENVILESNVRKTVEEEEPAFRSGTGQ